MRFVRVALLAAVAILPVAARAQSAPVAAAPVKPIGFTERTLANGLRVYSIPDKTTPNVAVQVWYDVGGKDDPKGRSGFAHLFEHLMFKATRNLVPEQFDRLTEDVGGYNNASTSDDYTNYFEVVPANHLEQLLFAEADRMASLVVERVSFASERDVVKEEYRSRVLAQPYGKLYSIYLPAITYLNHPYARGVIGSIDNLDSATIDDVRAFHATYYRPDNAILVVSGNFEGAQLDAWIDRYFGGIARPARAIPRVTIDEPARTSPVSYTMYEPNTPLPAIVLSYPLPPDRDPDSPALQVMTAILSRGESSRLYESLVYRQQLAQSADIYLDSKQGPGALSAIAIVAGGKDVGAAETALRAELARMRDMPVTAAELKEAKNEIVTATLQSLETAEGKARMLAASVIIDGDPRASERQLAAIQAITPADIQRVARTYLADNRAATIRYLPAEAKTAATPGDTIAIAPTVKVAALAPPADITRVTPASAADRAALPPIGAPLPTAVPQPVEMTLANGLKVVTVERHDVPIVTAQLVALGGAALDQRGKAGTASLAADLLTKGTTTRSATQIASAAEALGASIGGDADRDGAALGMTVRTSEIAPALAILADVAQHPKFAADELDRARAQAIDAANVAVKNPGQLAGLAAARAVFGTGSYAATLNGTAASLKAITRADVARSYAETWSPARTTLVLAGDVTPDQARALAEQAFGGWRAPAGAHAVTPMRETALPAPRVIVVDMPDAGQAGVVVARGAIPRSDPDYYAAELANTVLGGGFSSRLNQEIRIKRGLAYGAGSALAARRSGGIVLAYTQTKNPSAPEVVKLIVAEMQRLGQAPAPAAAEIDTRKAVLIGGFGRSTETTEAIAGIVGSYAIDGVALAELQRYAPSVQAIAPAAVQAAAARLLDPAAASIVVVGDAKLFVDDLRKAYPALELIPASALDLDKAALK